MNTRIAAAGLVLLAVVAGVFAYVLTHSTRGPAASHPVGIVVPSTRPGPSNIPPTTPPKEATIYAYDPAHGDENGLAPVKVPITDRNSPAKSAMESLIDESNSPLPSGTRLQGIKIDDGTATVDFSNEFQKNFHGGDMQEAAAVNSVLMTLGQFHTIDRVQILVDGQSIDSLGGHFELSEPLDVIRPTSNQQAKNE